MSTVIISTERGKGLALTQTENERGRERERMRAGGTLDKARWIERGRQGKRARVEE